jgi:predicted porin
MNIKKKLIASAILSIFSFSALADTASFNNLEIGYTDYDFGNGIKLNGFEISVTREINDNIYITADTVQISDDGFDLGLTTLGLGFKTNLTNSTVFFSELSYADLEGDIDDSGYEVAAGIRSMVTAQLELKTAVEYINIDDDSNTSIVIGAAYNFTDSFAAYTDYSYDSDLESYAVGLRYIF